MHHNRYMTNGTTDLLPRYSHNICKIEGCVESQVSFGRCPEHHNEWIVNETGIKRNPPILKGSSLKEALEFIKSTSFIYGKFDCLVAARIADPVHGYLRFFLDRKDWSLHRASYKVYNGQIFHDMTVHHTCANRACFNPDHLQQVTQEENTAEMLERHEFQTTIAEQNKTIEELKKIIKELKQTAV